MVFALLTAMAVVIGPLRARRLDPPDFSAHQRRWPTMLSASKTASRSVLSTLSGAFLVRLDPGPRRPLSAVGAIALQDNEAVTRAYQSVRPAVANYASTARGLAAAGCAFRAERRGSGSIAD